MMKVKIFVSLLLCIGKGFSRIFASQRQPGLPGHVHGHLYSLFPVTSQTDFINF